ncbi:MAG: hypothetical protein RJA81_1330 [Planctomycetota bacterium]|jgi:hypothetical protein
MPPSEDIHESRVDMLWQINIVALMGQPQWTMRQFRRQGLAHFLFPD